MPLRPIKCAGSSFPTVQEAFLHALKVHEHMAESPAYRDYPADQLRHLLRSLNEIRDGIAARAVPDEMQEAA